MSEKDPALSLLPEGRLSLAGEGSGLSVPATDAQAAPQPASLDLNIDPGLVDRMLADPVEPAESVPAGPAPNDSPSAIPESTSFPSLEFESVGLEDDPEPVATLQAGYAANHGAGQVRHLLLLGDALQELAHMDDSTSLIPISIACMANFPSSSLTFIAGRSFFISFAESSFFPFPLHACNTAAIARITKI